MPGSTTQRRASASTRDHAVAVLGEVDDDRRRWCTARPGWCRRRGRRPAASCSRHTATASTAASMVRGTTTPIGTCRKLEASVEYAARDPASNRTSPSTRSRKRRDDPSGPSARDPCVTAHLASSRPTVPEPRRRTRTATVYALSHVISGRGWRPSARGGRRPDGDQPAPSWPSPSARLTPARRTDRRPAPGPGAPREPEVLSVNDVADAPRRRPVEREPPLLTPGRLGLVTRTRARHDGRAVDVRLTPAGRRQVQAVREARRTEIRRVLDRMSDRSVREAVRGFTTFEEAADATAEDPLAVL